MAPYRRSDVGKTCPTCNREILSTEIAHDMDPVIGCSEYCEVTTDAEKARFLEVREKVLAGFAAGASTDPTDPDAERYDDWCVFPCAECGCPTEDGEWVPGSICSDCHPKVQLRVLREAAKATVEFLNTNYGRIQLWPKGSPSHGVDALLAQIDKALKR